MKDVTASMPDPDALSERIAYSGWALPLRVIATISLSLSGNSHANPRTACPARMEHSNNQPQTTGPLRATFMGTSTLLFDDGTTQILIDGFFSRPPVLRALAGWLTPDPSRIAFGLARGGVNDRLQAVFVAHAHHDHAMDAPAIAAKMHTDLVGSTSVRYLGLGQGVPQGCILVAEHRIALTYGRFTITPIETPHSKPEIFPGSIRKPQPSPTWASHFRTGTSYSFLIEHGGIRVLVYPTATVKRARLDGIKADFVYLGTGGLVLKTPGFVNRYWRGVVRKVGAKRVIPIHWDDMGRPLDKGLRAAPWPTGVGARSRSVLVCLARQHGIMLGDAELFEPVVLEMPVANLPDGDAAPLPLLSRLAVGGVPGELRPGCSQPRVRR